MVVRNILWVRKLDNNIVVNGRYVYKIVYALNYTRTSMVKSVLSNAIYRCWPYVNCVGFFLLMFRRVNTDSYKCYGRMKLVEPCDIHLSKCNFGRVTEE